MFAFFDDDRNGLAAILEVKFGKKTQRITTEPCERSVQQLFDTLEPVALAVEGSDLGTTEDPFEPTARCIRVPRSSAELHRGFVHHILEDEVDGQKKKQGDQREDGEEGEVNGDVEAIRETHNAHQT